MSEAKLRRCVKLLHAFQTRRELATRHAMVVNGCDAQTARRDLKSLIDAGVPLTAKGDGHDRRYLLEGPRGSAFTFSQGDAFALHFGRKLLSFLEGTTVPGWMDELRAKLDPSTPRMTADAEDRLARKLVYLSEPYRPYAAHDDVLNEVLSGLLAEQRLTLEYEGRSGTRTLEVMPLALVIYRRALYLLARRDSGDLRLPLDRMRSAHRGVKFAYPPGFDPETEVRRGFGIFDAGEAVEEVRLRFAPEVADLVQERVWHPSQRFEALPGGGVDLVMDAHGPELGRLALEWGDKVEVVSPAALRERVQGELRAALDRYCNP